MKVVYLCHPFSGDVAANCERVRRFCLAVKHEVVPIAPHLLLPHYIDEATERDLALRHGLALLRGADELWVCADPVSEGMAAEITKALRLGIPIRKMVVDVWPIPTILIGKDASMSEEKKASRRATIALCISVIAVAASVTSAMVGLLAYRSGQETKLSVKCEPAYFDIVSFEESGLPLAFSDKGLAGGFKEPPPGYKAYPKALVLFTVVRVSNLSSKNVTIEDLMVFSQVGNVGVSHPAILRERKSADGGEMRLPQLLKQGEQVVYVLKVAWPVEKERVSAVEAAMTKLDQPYLLGVLQELRQAGIELGKDSDGVQRFIKVEVVAADKTSAFDSCGL